MLFLSSLGLFFLFSFYQRVSAFDFSMSKDFSLGKDFSIIQMKGLRLKNQPLNSLWWPIYVFKSVDNTKLPYNFSTFLGIWKKVMLLS